MNVDNKLRSKSGLAVAELASSQSLLVARARRIRHGQDGGAGKRPDRMNFSLVPLLWAIQPVTSCGNIISLTVASTSADNAPSARTSAIPANEVMKELIARSL
jgi:hypothetical protein